MVKKEIEEEEKPQEKAEKKQKEAPKKAKRKGAKKLKAAFYAVKGGKIERKLKSCQKCGAGVFMAEHNNRLSCGACGYTEWKGK